LAISRSGSALVSINEVNWPKTHKFTEHQNTRVTRPRAPHSGVHYFRPSHIYCCRPDCLQLAARLSPWSVD